MNLQSKLRDLNIHLRSPFSIALIVALAIWGALCFKKVTLAEELSSMTQTADFTFFEQRVRPLLIERCYECHSSESGNAEGQLLLDSKPSMRTGGTRGDVLAKEANATEALLIRAVLYAEPELQMPPDGKLPDSEIAILREWIDTGAADPRVEKAPEAASLEKFDPTQHWAFQKPKRAELALALDSTDAIDPIDQLINRQLSNLAGTTNLIASNPRASDEVMIRRLYNDLLGLPPTMQAIEQFKNDSQAKKYERLVDSLLSEDAFAERMTRHWMDVMRYSDTKGYVFTESREYPMAFTYRDWLILAFKNDLPYDKFLRYQLAADVIEPANENGNQAALGMLTLGRRFLNNRHDIADDRIDLVTRGLMGLSVACARCHDHKFDPVTMGDYYSLHSVFINSKESNDATKHLYLSDDENIKPAVIFKRGNSNSRGAEVDKRFVKFISLSKEYELKNGSGRIDLADAITDPENPLTARTYVNRVWGWMLNKSIVSTPSDLGVRSPEPLHREVLDELAVSFIADGWSTKKLVRRIVLTQAYQRSSDHSETWASLDPTNEFLWRGERRRLDFEALRDGMLASTGLLDRKIGGKSETLFGERYSTRRTLYAYIDRQNLPNVFRAFDFANPDTHVPQRLQTTVPQQGLFLLNNDFIIDLSIRMSSDLQSTLDANVDDESITADAYRRLIVQAFERILRRRPHEEERALAKNFLMSEQSSALDLPEARWHYGYGSWSREELRLLDFNPLPFFEDGRWKGSKALPDPEIGWCFLSSDGGHPGEAGKKAIVRKWVAPRDGVINLRSSVQHKNKKSDGVIHVVFLNAEAISPMLEIVDNEKSFVQEAVIVKANDEIAFLVDAIQTIDSDSFKSNAQIEYSDNNQRFDSVQNFSGPKKEPPNKLAQLIQGLLICNEFCFID